MTRAEGLAPRSAVFSLVHTPTLDLIRGVILDVIPPRQLVLGPALPPVDDAQSSVFAGAERYPGPYRHRTESENIDAVRAWF